MKHYLEKNYPRKSRTTEFLFFILFIVLMGNDSNLLIVFYVQIMPDDFVMQL
ncbi:DUF4014 family protein, partial [Escherichia coli]